MDVTATDNPRLWEVRTSRMPFYLMSHPNGQWVVTTVPKKPTDIVRSQVVDNKMRALELMSLYDYRPGDSL